VSSARQTARLIIFEFMRSFFVGSSALVAHLLDLRYTGTNARNLPYARRQINSALVAKCAKSYGPNCVLAVCVFPTLTRAWEMESRLEDIRVPATNPFDAIYLCGVFPAPIGTPAELRVWKLA
jgi:hypothetical protein